MPRLITDVTLDHWHFMPGLIRQGWRTHWSTAYLVGQTGRNEGKGLQPKSPTAHGAPRKFLPCPRRRHRA